MCELIREDVVACELSEPDGGRDRGRACDDAASPIAPSSPGSTADVVFGPILDSSLPFVPDPIVGTSELDADCEFAELLWLASPGWAFVTFLSPNAAHFKEPPAIPLILGPDTI
jgi:hypothetical protein